MISTGVNKASHYCCIILQHHLAPDVPLCNIFSRRSCPTATKLLCWTENVNYLPHTPDNHIGSFLIRTRDTL